MIMRRQMLRISDMAVASTALSERSEQQASPDYTLEIAPYALRVSQHKTIKTTAYNQQVRGPLLPFTEVGVGPVAGTDHLIVKGILGRHFGWPKKRISNRLDLPSVPFVGCYFEQEHR